VKENCRLKKLNFLFDILERGESIDFFLFMEKFDGKNFQSSGNGGAWYIEKLSSNKLQNFNKAK
jgi:hypothetical protein